MREIKHDINQGQETNHPKTKSLKVPIRWGCTLPKSHNYNFHLGAIWDEGSEATGLKSKAIYV